MPKNTYCRDFSPRVATLHITEKVAVGSANSRRVFSMSLLRHIGSNCACTHAYIPVSTKLQDNMMQLSKLLLTGYQFSIVRIPMKYVVVLRGARLAV